MAKKKFKKENCSSKVRVMKTKDCFGFEMTLVGKHAYEWEIVIEEDKNKIKAFRFSNREKAIEEFNKRQAHSSIGYVK